MTNGSQKQIKWANDIRDNILNGLYAMKEAGFNVVYTIKRLENATNAKWWIERQTKFGFRDVLPEIEFNRHDEVGKSDIKEFYFRQSRNEYATTIGDGSIVLFKHIKSLKEKL